MGHVRVDLGSLYILVYDITRNILMVDSGVASCQTSLRDNISILIEFIKKKHFFEQKNKFGRCLGIGAGENNEM